MNGLARLAISRPRATLAAWAAAIATLALLGTGTEARLTQSIFVLPGTETERSVELAAEEFGENVIVPILLEGPAREIDRQGPALAAALAARPDARVLTPWDRAGGAAQLRPGPRAAMLVATFDIPFEDAFDELAPEVRAAVAAEVSPPLRARISGFPVIANDIKEVAFDSVDRAERIAFPILLVVLLAVFRAPVAAAIPAAMGLATVLAASGVIWLLAGPLRIDPVAVALASMMGLALGVDYSLLIVSRFREELRAGTPPADAALAASATAGRTVLWAGGTLVAAMSVALLVVPGDLLLSATVGVMTATVLSVVAAVVAIPAALRLLGGAIDRWRIGGAPRRPRRLGAAGATLRRPGIVAAAIVAPLLLLGAEALALDTGPPDPRQLPEDNRARRDFERVSAVMGRGWTAPFEVVAVGERGTITEPDRLRGLRDWQRRIAADRDVVAVIGPGRLARQSRRAREGQRELRGADRQLRRADRQLRRGGRGLEVLGAGVGQAEAGIAALEGALAEAERVAGELAAGEGEAGSGARDLAGELGAATGGAELIEGAIREGGRGARRLLRGLREARRGTQRLVPALGTVKDQIRFTAASGALLLARSTRATRDFVEELSEPAERAEAEVAEALRELDAMTIGEADPRFEAVREAVAAASAALGGGDGAGGEAEDGEDAPGLVAGLERVRLELDADIGTARALEAGLEELGRGLGELAGRTAELRRGIRELAEGGGELVEGVGRIRGAVAGLRDGLATLADRAGELEGGLRELGAGGRELAGGLGEASGRVGALVSGLGEAGRGIADLRRGNERLRRESTGLRRGGDRTLGAMLRRSPRLFESGHFVLAGIDGAPDQRAEQVELTVNASRGGEAGRVVVVPASGPNEEETAALRERLSDSAGPLADELGAETAVGGTAAALAEYDEITSGRLLWLILALAAVSYVVLVPIFRSLVLPAIAVALNLLSVGAAFGALALLFQGDDPLLGGPGYIDAVSINAIYTVVFGLSLDYQVFLIARMREGWTRFADTEAAISHGLERTAAVVTGAALIMTAVFLAFALSELATTRQFGVGLAIAVIVDATIVRLLLLPVVMRLAGDRCWTLPGWLERRLGEGDAEAVGGERE